MRAVLLINPRSGRGRAVPTADAAEAAMHARGIDCTRLHIGVAKDELATALCGASALVVVGGDGTVRSMLAQAAAAGVPLAVAPTGTENLAAREFGFMCPPQALAKGLRAGRVRRVDLGEVNGVSFLILASAGFDADVVHAVHRSRRGPITRGAYVAAGLSQAWGWRASALTVVVDGQTLFQGSGHVVVANCGQYALRLDPARGADPADGVLDVIVVPLQGAAQVMKLAASVAWSAFRDRQDRTVRRARGRQVEVTFGRPVRLQVDGDPVEAPPASSALFTLTPGALRVVDMRSAGIA